MPRSSFRSDEEIAAIYERHVNTIYRVCFTYLKNRANTEDMVQDTFLQLIRANPDLKSVEHEKAWLIRVAGNLCKNFLKHWWQRREDIADYEYSLGEADGSGSYAPDGAPTASGKGFTASGEGSATPETDYATSGTDSATSETGYATEADFATETELLAPGPESDSRNEILTAVLKLPEHYRIAIYLYYYEGYNTREIAALLRRPASTIRNHLHEARQLLRGQIEDLDI